MCGLVGAFGDLSAVDVKVFKNMLQFDVIRGPHSTGVAMLDEDNNVSVLKKALLPDDLFTVKSFDKIVGNVKKVGLLGHNRYATQGAINGANAHPFEHGNIVGAHNGTLRDQTLLMDHAQYEVDSDNLFHHIRNKGIEDCWGLLDGAAALTYYDKEDGSLNIIRNKERTLYYTYSHGKGTMYYASERWMLEVALSRNSVKYGKVHLFEENTLYSFKETEGRNVYLNYLEVTKKKVKPFQKKTPSTVSYIPKKQQIHMKIEGLSCESYTACLKLSHPNFPDRELRLNTSTPAMAKIREKLVKDGIEGYHILGEVSAVSSFNGTKSAYVNTATAKLVPIKKETSSANGTVITKEEFEKTKEYHKCAWCDTDVTYKEVPESYLGDGVSEKLCICPDCMQDQDVQKYLIGDMK